MSAGLNSACHQSHRRHGNLPKPVGSRLDHSLVPDPGALARGLVDFRNAAGPVTARGLETTLRLGLDEIQVLAAYTFRNHRTRS